MLGAGLRREFPGAFEWAGRMRQRLPHPRVSRTGMVWAVLAGLGAKALVAAAITLVASVLLFVVDTREWRGFRAFELREGLSNVVGGAVALAVALRAGSWRAVLGLIAVLAATDLANVAASAPGRALFCARSGYEFGSLFDPCAPRSALDEIIARWPLITGLAAGLLLARWLRSGRSRSNASLEAVGAVVAGSAAAWVVAAPFSPAPGEAPVMTFWTILSGLYLAMALVGGHILARRGARPWPAAILLAALFFVAPWLPTLVYAGDALPSDAPAEHDWLAIAPAGYAVAFVLASVITAALARPRPPDADAARHAAR